jgi:hypothetical protein
LFNQARDGPDHRPVCKCSGDWNDEVEIGPGRTVALAPPLTHFHTGSTNMHVFGASAPGTMMRTEPQVEIVDIVRIPAGLKAGKYVLGWRWDCGESTLVARFSLAFLAFSPPHHPCLTHARRLQRSRHKFGRRAVT